MNLDFLPKDREPTSPEDRVIRDRLSDKQKKISARVIWTLAVLSILIIVGIVTKNIISQQKKSDISSIDEMLNKKLASNYSNEKEVEIYGKKILKAIDIVKKFSSSSPYQEKLSLIHNPEAHQKSLQKYFEESQPKITIIKETPYLNTNEKYYVAIAKDQEGVKVIQIPLDKETIALDWEAYIGQNEAPWLEHRNKALHDPNGIKLRCIIRLYPSPYYNNYYSNEKEWVCLSIIHPSKDHSIWVYVKRGSDLHFSLKKLLARTTKKAVILQLKTNSEKELKDNQFEVLSIVSKTWSNLDLNESND